VSGGGVEPLLKDAMIKGLCRENVTPMSRQFLGHAGWIAKNFIRIGAHIVEATRLNLPVQLSESATDAVLFRQL
jgi:hypothetical protein